MYKDYKVGGLFPIVLCRRKYLHVLASSVVMRMKKNYSNIIVQTSS